MKKQCEDNGLVFDVVESIPVHEDIKLGRNNVDELLEVYCENIRRCAKYGVKCVTYNFMPVFDWTRTQLDKEAADGSTSLVMYFELHTVSWAQRAYGRILKNSSRKLFP